MSKPEKMPLSPMLVQYLVGLCALKWDAKAVNVEVTLGDMVPDQASGTRRDVDVTVTVDTPDGLYAFKGYEVKHWSSPLDVADVEALATKLKDMPSVTHGAIVSTSGFTRPAIKKAEHHEVDLYAIKPWTKPLARSSPCRIDGLGC
jgi:Restriction endonuclease